MVTLITIAWTIESSVIASSTRNPVREMPGQGRHDGGRNQEISPVTSRQPTNGRGLQLSAFLGVRIIEDDRQYCKYSHNHRIIQHRDD